MQKTHTDVSVNVYLSCIEGKIRFQTYKGAKWLCSINLGDQAVIYVSQSPNALRNLEALKSCVNQAIEMQKQREKTCEII